MFPWMWLGGLLVAKCVPHEVIPDGMCVCVADCLLAGHELNLPPMAGFATTWSPFSWFLLPCTRMESAPCLRMVQGEGNNPSLTPFTPPPAVNAVNALTKTTLGFPAITCCLGQCTAVNFGFVQPFSFRVSSGEGLHAVSNQVKAVAGSLHCSTYQRFEQSHRM